MKLLLSILFFSLLSASCHEDKKDNKPADPIGPIKPLWAGVCDVDYSSLQIEHLEENAVVIDDRGIDEHKKIVHLNELNSLPKVFLKMLGERKVPIKMINGGVANFEELSNLKGKPVRPSNPDQLWDDLAGVTAPQGVFLGTTIHGSNSVSIHESGHAIDFLVDLTDKSPELTELYAYYSTKPSKSDKHSEYRMSHRFEFFAASFDDFYCNKNTNKQLKAMYPKLHSYFENRMVEEIQSLPINEKAFE